MWRDEFQDVENKPVHHVDGKSRFHQNVRSPFGRAKRPCPINQHRNSQPSDPSRCHPRGMIACDEQDHGQNQRGESLPSWPDQIGVFQAQCHAKQEIRSGQDGKCASIEGENCSIPRDRIVVWREYSQREPQRQYASGSGDFPEEGRNKNQHEKSSDEPENPKKWLMEWMKAEYVREIDPSWHRNVRAVQNKIPVSGIQKERNKIARVEKIQEAPENHGEVEGAESFPYGTSVPAGLVEMTRKEVSADCEKTRNGHSSR